jgi:hypothetical protein
MLYLKLITENKKDTPFSTVQYDNKALLTISVQKTRFFAYKHRLFLVRRSNVSEDKLSYRLLTRQGT